MSFASPLWLMMLLPWAAVAVWLFLGRREGTEVPFLALWSDQSAAPRERRSVRPPPVALVFALLAALLAVLASARPTVGRRDVANEPRGATTAPLKLPQNAAITALAVRDSPKWQAMVTVRNESDMTRAALVLRAGDRTIAERQIELPARGGNQNYFLDLPPLESGLAAELQLADDITADNVAAANRQSDWPAIEIRSGVPAEVRRVAEAYARTRPPRATSPRVALGGEEASGEIPSVMVVPVARRADGGAEPAPEGEGGGEDALQVAAHPINAGVDWGAAKPQAADRQLPARWKAIVSIDRKPVVAVRESPRRQVLVSFDAPDFARTPDFVIFWTNVFDWLAAGVDSGDGKASQHWVSTVATPPAPPPATNASTQPNPPGQSAPQPHARELTSPVLIAALACLLIAAIAWPGRRLTAFSAPRTV